MKTYTPEELREIDAEIAVKVFGWVLGYAESQCLHYSTDIAAAWKVVELLGSMFMDATAPELGIDVEFTKGCRRTAQTAPLAICLAGLAAVEARKGAAK